MIPQTPLLHPTSSFGSRFTHSSLPGDPWRRNSERKGECRGRRKHGKVNVCLPIYGMEAEIVSLWPVDVYVDVQQGAVRQYDFNVIPDPCLFLNRPR